MVDEPDGKNSHFSSQKRFPCAFLPVFYTDKCTKMLFHTRHLIILLQNKSICVIFINLGGFHVYI